MNTQPFLDRSRASIAALLAFLLVVAGALTAVPAFAAGPSVSATQAPRAGGAITVTGSGFSGVAPGVYVGVGPAGLSGFYGGAMGDVVWVSPGNADGSIGSGRTAPMTAEGTFSVQVSVPAHTDGAQYTVYTSKAHGGGMTDPSQNATTPIAWEPLPAVATTTTLTVDPAASSLAGADFTLGATVEPAASGTVSYFNGETQLGSAAVGTTVTASIAAAGTAQLKAVFTPADAAAFTGSASSVVPYEITAPPTEPGPRTPTLTLSKTTGLDRGGETVTVTGSGYNPNQPIYVAICTDVPLSELSFTFISAGCTVGAKQVTSNPTTATQVKFNADGSFTTEFRVSPKAGSTAVYTLANHTAMNDRSQDAKVSLSFAPKLTLSKATGLDAGGETVTVTGAGYNPNQPIYVAICTDVPLSELSFTFISAGCTVGAKQVTSNPTTATQVKFNADGSFTTEFRVAPKAGSTAVYTLANHTAMNDRSQDAKVSVSFAAPKPVATLSVSKTEGLDPAGESITVTGTGYEVNTGGIYAQIGWIVEGAWTPISASDTRASNRTNAYAALVGSGYPNQPAFTVAEDGSGSFSWTVTIDKAKLDAKKLEGGTLAVFTLGSHSNWVQPANERFVPLSFADPEPVPALDVTVRDAAATTGATIKVSGSNLPDVPAVYAAVIEKGTESQVTAGGGYTAFALPFPSVTAGSTTFTVVAPAAKLDRTKQYEVIVWKQHSNPAADTIYARADVPFTADHWTKLFPDVTPPTDPEPPVDPGTPVTPPAAVQGGSLSWAISSSFASYITSSTAKGSIAVAGGATRSGGLFQFGQATGGTYDAATGTGTVSYNGSVRFTGHGGVLDVTIANPQVRITSANAATLYVTSGGSQVAFANLDLSAAVRVTANGTVSYSRVPATLTAAGRSQVFQGYTTVLDPLAFTVGAPAAAPAGSTGTVAVAAASTTRTTSLPAAPPASTGIDLDDDTLAALQKGEPVTVSASGFTPNEDGIKVVVYSTPTLLGEVAADASGNATWTGSLPATLADGEHTLTFQGSVDRGIRFTLARAATAAGCFVEAASLNWGFKETFRTYIEGIAAGGWELTDVAYEYPEFVWTAGTGAVDAATRTGLVTYGGSIRFTGHQGALDTTLANARVELAGDTGYLVFDVSGTTQAGEPVTAAGVRFAEFALPDLEVTDDGLVLDALPATLTDAGAAAFGTYPAGDELDPVSAVLPVAGDCAVAAAPVKAEEVPVAEAAEAEVLSADQTTAPVWPWALVGIALALGIGAVVWIVVSRRRATAGGNGDQTAG
ncbi:HtaA domain-containing protein [Microbacterium sp. NPDC056057]|uniref:HtaA domain-containing protein n=1 Tax=Microbacterium sp. NPDC056057 TaxID=3345699 RepID=UPI0035E26696